MMEAEICILEKRSLETSALEGFRRLRRNRKSPAVRSILQETRLHPSHFIAPLFLVEGSRQKQSIPSMPQVYRLSPDLLVDEVLYLYKLGMRAIDLFAYVPQEKKIDMAPKLSEKTI